MLGLDFFAAIQVGYCAGYPQDAVVASGGETHDLEGVLHKIGTFITQGTVSAHFRRTHPGVAKASMILYPPCLVHSLLDIAGRLRFRSRPEFI